VKENRGVMESRPLFHAQPCVLCGAPTERRLTELTYTFDRVRIVVRDVPVAVCVGCNEEYVPGEIGVWLGDEVAKIAERLQAVLADETALHDMVVNVGVDGDRLIRDGRLQLPALT